MIGYLTNNKDFFKGNMYEYNLKKSISFSAGNSKQYEFFKLLLTFSIFNNTTKTPLHDSRAAQFLLHLFPLKIQILLSILLFKYESNLFMEFNDFSLDTSNILLPSQQLQYNSIITNYSISNDFLLIIDNIVRQNLDIDDTNLSQIKQLFNIDFTINDLNGTLIENIERLLNKIRVPNISKNQYINIVKNNSRLDSAIITAKVLNYKPQSIQYLTEAVSLWQQNLNI